MAQRIDADFARDFLHRLHTAVNAHDAEGVASLCSEEVLWDDPAAPVPLRGRDAVRNFHRDTMFRAIPDVRVKVIDGPYLSLDGTGAAVRLRISGTMTGPLIPPGFGPTGGVIEFETAEFSHFAGDLLDHHSVVLNMLELARQIGAVPKTGSLGERMGIWLQRLSAGRTRRQHG